MGTLPQYISVSFENEKYLDKTNDFIIIIKFNLIIVQLIYFMVKA